MKNCLSLVQDKLRRSGYEGSITAGIVLTGGSSRMEGCVELAEEIFHTQVRVGVPQFVSGLADVVRNPIYATGVGLLLFGRRQAQDSVPGRHFDSGASGMWERMKSWFHGNF